MSFTKARLKDWFMVCRVVGCAVGVALLCSGCITKGIGEMYSPRRHIVAAAPGDPGKASTGGVEVNVTGVVITPGFISKDRVGYNAEVKAALIESIAQAGRFPPGAPTRYRLVADIETCNTPAAGLKMTADVEVIYTLTETATGREVWKQSFTTADTKTMEDTITGAYRMYMALNAAFRKNIEAALTELAEITLD